MNNEFMRIFQNKQAKTATIEIDGYIGFDPWKSWEEDSEKQNTRQRIKQQLKELAEMKVEEITVNINSYGGDVNHGISIHDALAAHKAKIITDVQGHTASAATIIAQAGDVRKMSDNALFLPHNASTFTWGDKRVHEQSLNDLNKMDDRIANIYSKAGNKTKDEYLEIMTRADGRGEWFTADEAQENGLIDDIYEPSAMAASFGNLNPEIIAKYGLPPMPGSTPENNSPEQNPNIKTGGNPPANIKKENEKMSDENKNKTDVKANFLAMEELFGAEKATEYLKNDLSMEDAKSDFIKTQADNIKDLETQNATNVQKIEDLQGETKTLQAKIAGLEEGADPAPKAGNLVALDDKIKDEIDKPEGDDTDTFMDKVQKIQDEKKLSREEAMKAAVKEFPELHKEFIEGDIETD
ncbi:MAG: Clp protease ClpP [candidate division Zixibacteria bacterium]|nr:Clp protease ClpP [candidate division Zixibacteria bacterium]